MTLLIWNIPQALLTCWWSFRGSCGFILLESSIYWYELPLPGTSKSCLLYGNKFVWIILSSVMQEVFMQPLPLCSMDIISKRLIHTPKALWTSFFPSAKNRSRIKLVSHFYPLQGESPVTLILAERGRMHSRLVQQESWGPNTPLGATKHSVWLPSKSLLGLWVSSCSLCSDNTSIDFHRTSVWVRTQDLAQKFKKKPSQLSNVDD